MKQARELDKQRRLIFALSLNTELIKAARRPDGVDKPAARRAKRAAGQRTTGGERPVGLARCTGRPVWTRLYWEHTLFMRHAWYLCRRAVTAGGGREPVLLVLV